MTWELNRSLFRRLVQLYIFVLLACVLVTVAQLFDSQMVGFSADFDALVAKRFGEPDPVLEDAGMVVLLAVVLWHLVATGGLLRFKNWARWGFWVSAVLMWILTFVPPLRPMYGWPLGSLLSAAFEGLFATIVLLSYSRDHGGTWFGAAPQQLSETN
jgi:hypothetical protein